MKLCRDLIKDLQKHIEDYSSIYEPEDRLEWQLVVSEVKAFLEAEYIVRVVDVDSSSVVLSHRFGGFCWCCCVFSTFPSSYPSVGRCY